jgi:hypothetical protein
MQYVTHGSHRFEKHKFGVTCPDAIFVESVPVPLTMKIVRQSFMARTPPPRNALRDPQMPLDAKTQVQVYERGLDDQNVVRVMH